MPRDELLYATFPNDDDLRPFHHHASPNAYVYVVSWNADEERPAVVKVGFTATPARWRKLVRRGGVVRLVVRAPFRAALDLESRVHEALEREPAGFPSRKDATNYLGPGSSGWVECYQVPHERVTELIGGFTANAVVQD